MRNSFSNEQYCGPERAVSQSQRTLRQTVAYAFFGLRQQYRLNVRQYASLGDRHAAKELVQLLVVAYRELKMSRDDPGLLLSRAALPANSSTSAARYSITAAR
ncbi:hypothetical protein EVAR_85393_1 [Eumeta japonica]|uniref:Uncharacterized protein n=1 Tax=Eumeta variegata TaxID=151549 RepID=A0A4C1SM38_EUMVA|nr:hypothetical protein EVAR_85393_1 [Eumeta japonica]